MSAGKCYGGCKTQVGPLAGWRKMENMDRDGAFTVIGNWITSLLS